MRLLSPTVARNFARISGSVGRTLGNPVVQAGMVVNDVVGTVGMLPMMAAPLLMGRNSSQQQTQEEKTNKPQNPIAGNYYKSTTKNDLAYDPNLEDKQNQEQYV